VEPSPELIVAAISALLSLVAGVLGARANMRAKQLDHELERQRRQENAAEIAQRILHRYRDPLLDAAQTLQSRTFNIVANGYLATYLNCDDSDERAYARRYTVFAVAEYMTWVEIVRRELRFLDIGDEDRNRQLLARLTKTQVTLQSDKIRGPFRVFRGRQRAIAELMMVPTGASEGPQNECIGYAAFCDRLDDDPDFAAWFDSLLKEVDLLVIRDNDDRIIQLQNDLVDLIDHLDPKALRIPPDFRHRLNQVSPIPVPAQAAR
jgi:hypothetical protein